MPVKTTSKTTTMNQSRVIPEKVTIENPKTIKVKMCALYISTSLRLLEGNEYELPSSLANELIKNKEAIKC